MDTKKDKTSKLEKSHNSAVHFQWRWKEISWKSTGAGCIVNVDARGGHAAKGLSPWIFIPEQTARRKPKVNKVLITYCLRPA